MVFQESNLLDPRAVEGHPAPLGPLVSEHVWTPDALRARFQRPPPWQPDVWREPRFSAQPMRPAAVLIGLVQRPEPTVLLTQRTAHLRSHSGQVAFPGGKSDEDDADAAATALREAHEEVGVPPEVVDVLGTLPVYTTGSAFQVTPVVGLLPPDYPTALNPHEVEVVFEVPLRFLLDPRNHRIHRVNWEGAQREWYSMPYHDGVAERYIWGATAGMLRNLYAFLRA